MNSDVMKTNLPLLAFYVLCSNKSVVVLAGKDFGKTKPNRQHSYFCFQDTLQRLNILCCLF